MPKLRCSVQTCVHNLDHHCDRNTIEVRGASAACADETSCGSFAERNGCDSCGCNSTKKESALCDIDCKATQCTYNSGCKCRAGEICVEGSRACSCDETACTTFETK